MGQYLSAPVTEKETEENENSRLAYGLAAMQGWRVSMEDAHISTLNLDGSGTALFSIFDGHGGKAVAKFAAIHLPQILVKLDSFKQGNLEMAIAEGYYKLDELLMTDEGHEELSRLAAEGTSGNNTLFSDVDDHFERKVTETITSQKKDMRRIDSSEEFRKSALVRDSVILTSEARMATAAAADKSKTQATPEVLLDEGLSSSLVSGIIPELSPEEEVQNEASTGRKCHAAEGNDDEEETHKAAGMGCTAVSAVIKDNMVIVANTGDSRCVRSRNGEAQALTLDHKPILFEEAQRIIKAGGFVRENRVNGALNVSRTIGDLDFKGNTDLPHTEQMVVATPDVFTFEMQPGDEFLILACDGIWDVLNNQEAVDYVRKRLKQGQSLKAISEAMCDHCLAPDLKGLCRGADNMSVIIVLFKEYADLDSVFHRMLNKMQGLFMGKKGR